MKWSHKLSLSYEHMLVLMIAALLLVGCAAQEASETTQPTPGEPPLTASRGQESPTPTPGPLSLVILHTNDTAGELDPCG